MKRLKVHYSETDQMIHLHAWVGGELTQVDELHVDAERFQLRSQQDAIRAALEVDETLHGQIINGWYDGDEYHLVIRSEALYAAHDTSRAVA